MRLNGCLMQMAVLVFTLFALIGATIYRINRVLDPTGGTFNDFDLSATQQIIDITNTAYDDLSTHYYETVTVDAMTERAEFALTPEYARTPTPTITHDPFFLTATGIVRQATQRALDITATSAELTRQWNATEVIRQATEGVVSLTPSPTPT